MNEIPRTLIYLTEDEDAWKLGLWISVYLRVKDENAYATELVSGTIAGQELWLRISPPAWVATST